MGLKDKLIAKLLEVLRSLSQKYLDFIKLPDGFLSVKLAIKALINPILKNLRSQIEEYITKAIAAGAGSLLELLFDKDSPMDDQAFADAVSQYVKRSPELRALSGYLDRDFSFGVASEITLACGDENAQDRIDTVLSRLSNIPSSGLNGEDLINVVRESSDFDSKLASELENLRNRWEGSKAQEIAGQIQGYLPYLLLVYDLFRKTLDWLDQNERPSKWFAKLLSARLRRIASIIQNFADRTITEYEGKGTEIYNSIKGLIDGIRAVDIGIAAMTLATAIYEDNLRKLQELAKDWVAGWYSAETCDSEIEEPAFENTALVPGIQTLSLSGVDLIAAAVSCQAQVDTSPIPRIPVDDNQASDVNCEVQSTSSIPSPPDFPTVAPQPPLSTTAVYSYLGNSTWSPIAKQGQDLKPEDPLFEVSYPQDPGRDSRIIRSSIIGKVRTVDKKNHLIAVDDYLTPEDRPLEGDLEDLNALYQERSNTQRFLKEWVTRLLYVPMLSRSPLTDASLAESEDLEIRYSSSVEKRWEGIRKDQSGKKFDGNGGIDKSYDKDIKKLTDKDKVTEYSEQERTIELKEQIDKRTDKYYKDLKALYNKGLSEAQYTKGKKDEVVLYDWYIEALEELTASRSSQYDLDYEINTPPEDKEPVVNKALDWTIGTITGFLSERAFIDGYNPLDIQAKIETYGQDLDGGDYFVENEIDPSIGYYGTLLEVYEVARSQGNSGEKALKVTPSTIDRWGKGKNAPDDTEASSLRFRIYKLFEFLQTVAIQEEAEYQTEETSTEATYREGRTLLSKFDNLWKNLQEIPVQIDEIVTKLDDQADSYVPRSEGTYLGEPATYFYTNDIPADCDVTADSGDNDLNKLKYWLRYCAFATLGSCTSPLSWGTGLPPPIGPLPLPTIYIPIKGFQLEWGVILLGITVTGIYPFPFLMVGNLSTSPVVPFADPATIIRREAQALKKGLLQELSNLKTITLEPAIEKAQEDVRVTDSQIADMEVAIANYKSNKPRRDRAAESGIVVDPSTGIRQRLSTRASVLQAKAAAVEDYAIRLKDWNVELATKRAALAELHVRRFAQALKAKVLSDKLNDIATTSIVDPAIQAIEFTEAAIEKAFDTLLALLNTIDPIIAALPISVGATSASFAFTLKNPRPFSKIADGFEDTVKADALQPFLDAIDLPNSALMSTALSSAWALTTSALNTAVGLFNSPASPIRTALAPVEPFPLYKNLLPINLSWWGIPASPVSPIGFIQPSWVSTGGKSFGIPGFK